MGKDTLLHPEDVSRWTSLSRKVSPPFPRDVQSQGRGGASPNALDHEVFLLGAHLHDKQ